VPSRAYQDSPTKCKHPNPHLPQIQGLKPVFAPEIEQLLGQPIGHTCSQGGSCKQGSQDQVTALEAPFLAKLLEIWAMYGSGLTLPLSSA
jgi:hypothetical protein